MSRIRLFLTAIAFGAAMSSGAAVAQTSASPAGRSVPAAPAPETKPTAATQVETWTTKQWEAAKKEWSKDKAKWADCRKQSSQQKLKGRKNWSFLYNCMKS